MSKPEFYVAVYGIIQDDTGEILCLQRANTGFMDGFYGLPAGHLEGEESLKQGVIREIYEEIGVEVQEDDVELVCNGHRVNIGERVYFDYYFKVNKYSGELKNTEPDKCSGLEFLSPQDERIIPYLREVFEAIADKKTFTEQYIKL